MDNFFDMLKTNWEHIIVIGLAARAVSLGIYDAIDAADEKGLKGAKRYLFITQYTLTYLLGKRA
jgi:hypothetical protein